MTARREAGEWRRYGAFFLLAAALGLAPGPDILFVFAQALAHGARAGALVTLGLCTGLCVHVALAAFGAAALLRRWPWAFAAVTWCGAAYLAALGVGAWRAAGTVAVGADGGVAAPVALPALRLYLRGVVMNVCNPKVMLFFLALMPRFIRAERGRVAAQFLLLGAVFALATLLVFNGVALGGGALAGLFVGSPHAAALLNRFSAIVLLGLAAWIAFTNLRPSPR